MMSLVIIKRFSLFCSKEAPLFPRQNLFFKGECPLHKFLENGCSAMDPLSLILTQWGSLRRGKPLVWNLACPFTNDDFGLENPKSVIIREIFRIRAFKETELEAHSELISMRRKGRNIGEQQGISMSKQSIPSASYNDHLRLSWTQTHSQGRPWKGGERRNSPWGDLMNSFKRRLISSSSLDFCFFFLEMGESFLPLLSQISIYLSQHACAHTHSHTHTQTVLLYNFLYYDVLKSW